MRLDLGLIVLDLVQDGIFVDASLLLKACALQLLVLRLRTEVCTVVLASLILVLSLR